MKLAEPANVWTPVPVDPVFEGLRLMIVAKDLGMGGALAHQLRMRGAEVVVSHPDMGDLQSARRLDPEVVLLDAGSLGQQGVEVSRTLHADTRLRWAAVLRCTWSEIWPLGVRQPNLPILARRIEPYRERERVLRRRATTEQRFSVEVDRLGPNRVLRVLTEEPGRRQLDVVGPGVVAQIELDNSKLVRARWQEEGPPALVLSGSAAMTAVMTLRSGLVRVWNMDVSADESVVSELLEPTTQGGSSRTSSPRIQENLNSPEASQGPNPLNSGSNEHTVVERRTRGVDGTRTPSWIPSGRADPVLDPVFNPVSEETSNPSGEPEAPRHDVFYPAPEESGQRPATALNGSNLGQSNLARSKQGKPNLRVVPDSESDLLRGGISSAPLPLRQEDQLLETETQALARLQRKQRRQWMTALLTGIGVLSAAGLAVWLMVRGR